MIKHILRKFVLFGIVVFLRDNTMSIDTIKEIQS